MNPKILEEKPISIYDLKKELKKISKRDTELSIRANKTDEYINQFATLKEKDAEDLENELVSLEIPRFKEIHIKKIVDTLPETTEELKVILQAYTLTVSKENMQKIISACTKHQASNK